MQTEVPSLCLHLQCGFKTYQYLNRLTYINTFRSTKDISSLSVKIIELLLGFIIDLRFTNFSVDQVIIGNHSSHATTLLYYKCIACAVLVIRHRSLVAYKRVLFIPLKVYQDNNIGSKISRFKFLQSKNSEISKISTSIRSYVHTHPFHVGGDVYGFMMFYLRPINAFFLDCIESIMTSQISAKQIAV